MKTETVELNGVPISKETILGWAAQCGVKIEPPKPEPYQFKVRDVAKSRHGLIKIILKDIEGNLVAYGTDGYLTGSGGQKDFERFGYVKIGELPDLLKVPEPKEEPLPTEPPKPKFEKIQFCHLRVDVPDPTNSLPIHLSWAGSENNTCLSGIKEIESHINGLQKAIAYTQENNGK